MLGETSSPATNPPTAKLTARFAKTPSPPSTNSTDAATSPPDLPASSALIAATKSSSHSPVKAAVSAPAATNAKSIKPVTGSPTMFASASLIASSSSPCPSRYEASSASASPNISCALPSRWKRSPGTQRHLPLQPQLAHKIELQGLHRGRLSRRRHRTHPAQRPATRPLLRPLLQQTPRDGHQSGQATPVCSAFTGSGARPENLPSSSAHGKRPGAASALAGTHPADLGSRSHGMSLLPRRNEAQRQDHAARGNRVLPPAPRPLGRRHRLAAAARATLRHRDDRADGLPAGNPLEWRRRSPATHLVGVRSATETGATASGTPTRRKSASSFSMATPARRRTGPSTGRTDRRVAVRALKRFSRQKREPSSCARNSPESPQLAANST